MGSLLLSMPVNRPALEALVRRVGEFYITDKKMKKIHDRMASAMAAGGTDEEIAAGYLTAVSNYFSGFEREAREHLRSVDKRLEHINQVHFNLSAERSVAVRRIEATQEVLAKLDAVEPSGAARV